MDKSYVGRRARNSDEAEPGTLMVFVVTCGVTPPVSKKLNPRLDLRNHSPTGFECGYAGSGPAQLALAICADVLGDDEHAQRVYQAFKTKVIAALPQDADWVLLADREVLDVIREIERT
jgi:hypothetical protein